MLGKCIKSHSENNFRLLFGSTLILASLTFHNFNSAVEFCNLLKTYKTNKLWKYSSSSFDTEELILNKHSKPIKLMNH